MASKTPKRAQEIRDLARALCILAWRDTNWSTKQISIDGVYVNVGNTVNRVWLCFPPQGLRLNIRFETSLRPSADTENRNRYWAGESLITSAWAPGDTRIEQIWWKMANAQKSFSGMDLLGTHVEVLTSPSEEASVWAEDTVAPYDVSPEAGVYKVSLKAPATVEYTVTHSYTSPGVAAEQATRVAIANLGNFRVNRVADLGKIEVVEVKKIS